VKQRSFDNGPIITHLSNLLNIMYLSAMHCTWFIYILMSLMMDSKQA